MQGKILDYNNEFKSGLIRGNDGNKYRFSVDDYESDGIPKVGAEVDFESNGDKAVEVYVLDQRTEQASATKSEPTPTINPETQTNVVQMVKKIVIWIIVAIVGFYLILIFLKLQESSAISDLKNKCTSNDATACYQLGVFKEEYNSVLWSANNLSDQEQSEALAKGCQLGNKDACRKGGYDERGCELKDGESCFNLTHYGKLNLELVSCQLDSESNNCANILKKRSEYEKKYSDLACEYGYSEGCMKK